MKIAVLCGGVGAARLLRGLQLIKDQFNLDITAVVNTGDDDIFYGQYVCPDIDSILYHLSDRHDELRGWGHKDETFHFVESLRELGIDAWFNLGDRDLAANYLRTSLLAQGVELRDAITSLSHSLGIADIDVIPMCNEKVSTTIITNENETLSLQEYFVRERCNKTIDHIEYRSSPQQGHPDVHSALNGADLIIIAPSNPYLSIDPIVSIEQINDDIIRCKEKVVAISPIVAGDSIKGPLAAILRSQGKKVSPITIAEHYVSHASWFVIDKLDEDSTGAIESLGYSVFAYNTIMKDDLSRKKFAQALIEDFV